MKYYSTRNEKETYTAAQAMAMGLAPDGGLFVPERIPTVTAAELNALCSMDYRSRAVDIMGRYLEEFSAEELEYFAQHAYAENFDHPDVAPLRFTDDRTAFLELWHGPTCAFKDMALQIMPRLLSRALRKTGEMKTALILVATSGDTGKAALEGFCDVPGVSIGVTYPHGGVSDIQFKQMATQAGSNVHVWGVRGNFDDCQTGVKNVFSDDEFAAKLLDEYSIALSSANSINWGRLLPQVVYYISAYAQLVLDGKVVAGDPIDVCVPTGNFGNILAAYYAKTLFGAPIRKFVCASNVNDVLTRFIATGTYDPGPTFTVTNSPSMDIRKSSNVERLLWAVNDGDGAAVKKLMDDFAATGRYSLSPAATAKLQADFVGAFATPEETEAEMRLLHDHCGYIVDPHTAVATAVARKLGYPKDGLPCVVAATATPYKFPETCLRAFGTDILTDPPASFVAMEKAPITQKQVVDVDGIDAAVRALF
jgi:threonine synthase